MATLEDFESVEAARAHTVIVGKMIHRNSMNAWLAQAGRYRRLKAIAADDTHPLADGVAAFLDSTEYNLIQSSETGQGVIALMQALIAAEGENGQLLQPVLDRAIAAANEVTRPFESASLYDWQRARGIAIPQVSVPVSGGWIKITVTQDVEPHRPQIYVETLGIKRRIAGFDTVSSAGDYLAYVGGFTSVWVDDAYGVIA